MKIADIRADCYRIPLPSALYDSTHGRQANFQLVTARVRDDEGNEGVGYTYTAGQGGLAIRSMITHDLTPGLEGADPRRTEQLWQQMWWRIHYVGRGGIASFAISALDIAIWDLNAQRQGEPLWRYLGGHDPQVPVYAGGVDLHLSPEELTEQTRENLAKGFRAIKVKVGRPQLAEDLERVATIREFLGPDIMLMVDANMGWRVDEAIRAARALQEFNLFWLEEPTIPDDVTGHVKIVKEGGVPIAAGENLHTIYEFQHLIGAGGVGFPEPDVANIGGITAWMKVAKLAEAHNLPVTSHGVHDLHVHLLASAPNASYLEVHAYGLERFLAAPLEFQEGTTMAPDRPGHGVQLNWEALEEHREGV